MRPKYDMLWKGMLEEVAEDLLLFVQPNINTELDFGRGFEFLDKELEDMHPSPEKQSVTRVVDKLVKVHLRTGGEKWMLLHVEVQGRSDGNFPKRMFQYYYRLFDRHDRPVAAIAVCTGRHGRNVSGVYEDRHLWMRTRYEYKTLCISDYPDEVLAASDNPFAVVVMVAKETLLWVKGTDEERDSVLLERKLRIVRILKEKMAVFGEKKTNAILIFLKNYVVFKNSETNRKFMDKVDQITGKRNTMGIAEQWAEIKAEEALERGRREGKEESVRLFLVNTSFSDKKIAEIVFVPVSLVKELRARIKEY